MLGWLTQAIVLAFSGGFALNVLKLIELQNVPKDRRPDFKDPLYWLTFAVLPIMGGFFGFLFDDERAPLSKVVAFQIGMSAPLILRALANAAPAQIHKQLPPDA